MSRHRRSVPIPAGPLLPGLALLPVVVGLLAVLALLTTTACGRTATSPAGGSGNLDGATGNTVPAAPVTVAPSLPAVVVGADGVEVTVADVGRIVPLSGSLAEIVFALGLGENVVGRDVSATFDEIQDRPLVTRAHDVSAESVLSLRPTLVLAQTDTGPPEALDQIRAAGVPVVVLVMPAGVQDVRPRVELVATALGVPEAGSRLAATIDERIETARAAVPAEAPPLRVAFLYLRGQAGVSLIGGPGSGADSMITAAGAVDAGTALGLDRAFTPMTSEALVQAAPEVILMTTTGLESVGGVDGLVAIPGIAQTPAGRDRRVVTVEDGLLYSFGPRTPDALEQLVAALHQGAER